MPPECQPLTVTVIMTIPAVQKGVGSSVRAMRVVEGLSLFFLAMSFVPFTFE